MRGTRGFTVVELLIVIVVIGILATLTIISYAGVRNQAARSVVQSDLEQSAKKLEEYRVKNNEMYPANQAAAIAAGVKASSGNTVYYTYDAGTNYYCLSNTASSGDVYFVNAYAKSPIAGSCQAMVSWLPLNGNPSSFTGTNDAAASGALPATGQSGRANGAYSFGGSAYMSTPSTSSLTVGTGAGKQLSVSLWYYGTHSDTTSRALLAKREANASASTDYIFMIEANTILWGTGTSTDSCAWQRVTEPSRNAWHHIVGTIDQTGTTTGTKKFYIDGVLQDTCTYASKAASGGTQLYIGSAIGANYTIGSIDDIRMFTRVLTDVEVSNMFDAGAQ